MNRETEELYARLCRLENRTGELRPEDGMIVWRFHEHLCIKAYVDDGDGYIGVDRAQMHYHPAPEAMFDELSDILHERRVFVSKVGIAGRYVLGVYPRDFFEKHKRWIKLGFGVRCMTSRGLI